MRLDDPVTVRAKRNLNGNDMVKLAKKKIGNKNKISPDHTEAGGNREKDVDALKLMGESQQPPASNATDSAPEARNEEKQPPAVLTDQEYLAASALDDYDETPQDCWAWLLHRPPPPPKPWCFDYTHS